MNHVEPLNIHNLQRDTKNASVEPCGREHVASVEVEELRKKRSERASLKTSQAEEGRQFRVERATRSILSIFATSQILRSPMVSQ